MHNKDDGQLASLEDDARSIEGSLVSTASSWALDQGALARAFLLQEARLVVVNQAEVTERIADEVPELKAEIEEICNEVTATFERWSASIGLAEAKTLAQDPRKAFLELSRHAHDAFGEAFIRRGYDPGSRDWTSGTSNWHFYIPETGTARNPFMKYAQGTDEDLSELWNSWEAITREITTTRDQIQRSRAATLWDAD
ncbi:hypothetical protein [Specibacter cremeus]|uniref:hypothetical protein n=1 Tax=Specibacter cremeus TaxID=1629051 RepID=UPI000F77B3EF|nr:hypothetical protein [Specibacter cremeus]